MRLNKIDLSAIKAIAHDGEGLKLLIERDTEIELIEIDAPVAAYEGLQLLNEIVAAPHCLEPSAEIEMLPVHSTMADRIGYDADRELLQIEFNNGAIYRYAEVEPEVWEDLQDTHSIGCFYNDEIKGCYPSTRIE